MYLETALRQSNARYKALGIGIVEKIPTEWIPLRGEGGKIVGAKVEDENKGVPDFMGAFLSCGPVAFDAKETNKGTRFPLEKIEPEQYDWLKGAKAQRWVVFTIHYFAETDKAFLLPFEVLARFYEPWRQFGGRKVPASIPEDVFEVEAYRIRPGKAIVLDYKAALDEYLQQREAGA